MAVVVIVESSATNEPLELTFDDGEPIMLGRDPRCQVQLPDASVSLQHAVIRSASDVVVLVDLGSTNGTWLNADRVAEGAPHHLRHGDSLRLGRTVLTIRFRSQSMAPQVSLSTQDIALALVQGALIDSGAAVAPRVRVTEGPDRGKELVLDQERSYVLGRDDDVDLKLVDDQASRRHTRVVRRGSRLWVVDLESRHGTQLDGRSLSPNTPEAWDDTAVVQIGRNTFCIEDPVSSALRGLERVPDERLASQPPSSESGGAHLSTQVLVAGAHRSRSQGPPSSRRASFSSVSDTKGLLKLGTSSSSSAPSAPIEVLHSRESEPPARPEKLRSRWSALDTLVIGVAVITIALSALALAWFLVS